MPKTSPRPAHPVWARSVDQRDTLVVRFDRHAAGVVMLRLSR